MNTKGNAMTGKLILDIYPGESIGAAAHREAKAFLRRCERSLAHAREVGRPAWIIAGLEEAVAEAKEEVLRG